MAQTTQNASFGPVLVIAAQSNPIRGLEQSTSFGPVLIIAAQSNPIRRLEPS